MSQPCTDAASSVSAEPQVADIHDNSRVTQKHHTGANAQARADASRIHRIARTRGISARAVCRLLAAQMAKGIGLEQACRAVEGGRP